MGELMSRRGAGRGLDGDKAKVTEEGVRKCCRGGEAVPTKNHQSSLVPQTE